MVLVLSGHEKTVQHAASKQANVFRAEEYLSHVDFATEAFSKRWTAPWDTPGADWQVGSITDSVVGKSWSGHRWREEYLSSAAPTVNGY